MISDPNRTELELTKFTDAGEKIASTRAAIHPPRSMRSSQLNGVVTRPLTAFDDAKRSPNTAVIALPIPQKTIHDKVESFKRSRSTLDSLEHVVRWLAFAWGAARTPNPFHENYGIPSMCMIETVCAASNLDLSPGLESRASCPEAVWAAASHWQEYFAKFNGAKPIGRYWTPHKYAINEP